jgi:hypothetical protein
MPIFSLSELAKRRLGLMGQEQESEGEFGLNRHAVAVMLCILCYFFVHF